ncbi:MAG: MFS transporter [Spirochaetales bacterium]|nr:MFS transporter [Spirochaetales bacterium]
MKKEQAKVSFREKLSFGGALMGQTILYNAINLYLLIFYTDVFGIGAAAAGTLFLLARIWDAVNDPIMGVIVDKTQTRWGKCRPYLLFAPIPICILTVLLFLGPEVGSVGKIIYASITYVLWGMFYTSLDIPIWSMSSRMSVRTEERQSIISFGRIFNIIGSFFPVILVVPMKQALGGGLESRGYFLTILIFALASLPLMMQSFFGTKERAAAEESKRPNLKESLSAIFGNTPLLMLVASNLLALFINLPVSAGIFFVTYNLGDESLFAVMAGTVLTSAIIGSLLAPRLARKFSSRKVLISVHIVSAVFFIAAWFIGYSSLTFVIVLTFIIGTLLGVPLVLRTSMLADTVEYVEMKTGKRSEGVIFSTLTFTSKLKIGVAAFLSGWILKMTDYIPNTEQTTVVLNGIMSMHTLLPALGCILTIIPLFFYKLSDEAHKDIIKKLSE